jgi:MSHA biogenesis protein MshG
MPLFYFKGLSPVGKKIQGSLVADGKMAASSDLARSHIKLISIQRVNKFRALLFTLKKCITHFVPIQKINLSTFYYQMAGMLAINMSLRNALTTIADNMLNPRFASVLYDINRQLSQGVSLCKAFSGHVKLFSASTIALIALARSRVDLELIFRYSDTLLQRKSMMSRLVLFIVPQLALFVLLIAGFVFLHIRYLHEFQYAIYVFNKPMPVVIDVFQFLTGLITVDLVWTVLLILVVIAVFRLVVGWIKPLGDAYDALLLMIPFVGGYELLRQRERLSLMTAILLKGGATIQKAIVFSASAVDNARFSRRLSALSDHLKQGGELAYGLRQYKIFGGAEVQLIALGIVANNLTDCFGRIVDIEKLLIDKRMTFMTELARVLMYVVNIFLGLSLIVVTETLFFYAQA